MHLAEKFIFLEVNNYNADDLASIIAELGTMPPKDGHSGFIATWRDGMGRLYEGQPQSSYIANWLLTLETTQLSKFLSGSGPRKAFVAQENVRVIGYFRDVNVGDPKSQFGDFIKVAKRYQLDIEFASIIDRSSAKALKLKYPGDIVILKPQENPIVWSSEAAEFYRSKELRDGTSSDAAAEVDEDEEGEDNGKQVLWTVKDLNEFIKIHQKPLWSEIMVPTMFKHWFSTHPKAVFVYPNVEARSRHEPTSQGFLAFKTLAKQYARQVGVEFLAADASVFSQLPVAIKVPVPELPAFTLFSDSKEIDKHVLKIMPNESPKEVQHKMKSFLEAYLNEMDQDNAESASKTHGAHDSEHHPEEDKEEL